VPTYVVRLSHDEWDLPEADKRKLIAERSGGRLVMVSPEKCATVEEWVKRYAHRIESFAKRLAKLEAVKEIEEQPLALVSHSGSMTMTGAELDHLLKQLDGRTRGIPSQPHRNENPRRYLEQTAGANQQGMERG